jgi:hypothetical protein
VYAQQHAIVGHPSGDPVAVNKGDAYDDSHPLVRIKPALFGPEPPEEAVAGGRQRPRIERATRAPGEVRRPGRGRG